MTDIEIMEMVCADLNETITILNLLIENNKNLIKSINKFDK